jgi:hypothetical protein
LSFHLFSRLILGLLRRPTASNASVSLCLCVSVVDVS